MRRSVLAALTVSAASAFLAGCGSDTTAPPTAPVTFTTTTTTPTSTVPAPTNVSYPGPEGMPIQRGRFLASATTTKLGAVVEGIQCEPLSQLAYTAYSHLQVYVEGSPRALPGGVGMINPQVQTTSNGLLYAPGTCAYWLHTAAADGVIAVQSPIRRRYTLGDFFRIWNQPLGTDRVAGARGPVTADVNGRRWRGNPAQIPLTEHAAIQLAVGRPVPAPQPVDWLASTL